MSLEVSNPRHIALFHQLAVLRTAGADASMSGATATASPGSPPEALEQRTMHVFISRALHKILREAPKKHTQLRAACSEVIGVPWQLPPGAREPGC